MKIETTPQLDFHNVLIRPKRTTISSRSQVNLEREILFPHSTLKWKGVPIIAANMDTTVTFEVYDELVKHKMITCFNKFYNLQNYQDKISKTGLDPNYFMISTGINEQNFSNLCDIVDATNCKWICIDVANGYTERFCTFIGKFRDAYPNIIIIAGNVCTADQTQELILKGADIIKCGIGPGSVCTTRVKTGVGYPQLSTIIECSDAAHGLGGHIISDGGCTVAGDIAKAFGGGADFVMLGGMLAGHDEGGGEIVDNKVQFYGMSSRTANEKHFGGLRDYRAAEGKTVEIPYRGKIINTVQDILGGLRSACTYSGARRLKDLCKCTTFIRTTVQENKVYS